MDINDKMLYVVIRRDIIDDTIDVVSIHTDEREAYSTSDRYEMDNQKDSFGCNRFKMEVLDSFVNNITV